MSNIDMRYVVIIAFVILVLYTIIQNKKQAKKKLLDRLKKNWGVKPGKRFDMDEFEKVSHYFKNSSQENVIDDITWNDLNMDEVFKLINNTNSSIGQEYLYKRLRNPRQDKHVLDETDRLARYFDQNEKIRIEVQKIFSGLGYSKRISISDYVDLLIDLKADSNIVHFLALILLVGSVIFCGFYNPVVGICTIIGAIAFSVITYYRYKAKVEHYFACVNQIVRMIDTAENINSLSVTELSEYNDKLKMLIKNFSKIKKNSWLLESGTVNGSLAEIILDYIRMLTHIDLIKFNNMIKYVNKSSKDIYMLMDTLGMIETSIAVASFRKMLPYWSIPEFAEEKNMKCSLEVKDVFHPLIEKPVANSIQTHKHILLTGSNASGKSTFLKTIAINAILAQTINTSVSSKYKAPVFNIYSSMALKDDLSNSDSYYIVEIKSLKRILDAVEKDNTPVLCFIDEVLRGTNTVERIAASSEILKNISNKKALCFAATHDVELTKMLAEEYENYHFQEEVIDDNVLFNFNLFKGPATTRNAIKLLNMIGYDSNIIAGAERKARYFLDNGTWDC